MFNKRILILEENFMFNKVLLAMGNLLEADAGQITKDTATAIINYVNIVVSALLGIVGAVAVVYAVLVGIKMARANNAEEREEAKKKVIYTVAGIAVTIALIVVINIISNKLPDWIGVTPAKPDASGGFIGL